MRTTLDIDDDVLHAAKEQARAEHRPAGSVLSEMARKGFQAGGPPSGADPATDLDRRLAAMGVRTLPRREVIVTNDNVVRLRDQLGV